MSSQYMYDLIVVGGGSGGLKCSKLAADLGAKVALLDYVKPSSQGSTWKIGGTCVNVGCIPKKQMHFASEMGNKIREAINYGWKLPLGLGEAPEEDMFNNFPHNKRGEFFDWTTLVQGVLNTRSGSNFVYKGELRKRKIDFYEALGRLVDSHTVELVGRVERLTAKYILLAPGGRPNVPRDIPGAYEYAITSDDLFSLQQAPGKTLVVGGSYIALECAGFLSGLGFDVSVMIEKLENNQKRVTFLNATENKEYTQDFDTVMFATGRYADVQGLNLAAIGVQHTKEGKIIVNDEERTSVESIYAIGDVIENGHNYELTPVAIQQGKYLAYRLFKPEEINKKVDYDFVPTTVFTPTEYGLVGYSEEKAKKVFGENNLVIYKKKFNILEHKIAEIGEKGFVKLICVKNQNERVVGLHYLGPNAAEVTQGFALALKKGCTKEEFDDVIGIHPSNAEAFMYLELGVYEDKTCCG
ncbi:predicted protein [Naegleria gruberi]|uniref:Predicted protein n=1 Tax=Naegleria gruberi TaxID=5762 RepID=D2V520_NAEGR|nr:uncharacterized protein NAEGRDRAFT_44345 [Naegleria gruberi]EFC48027.1 predicted protein [Naegleria gruberi]|eukprot:XP_002680771.1 predicted protein [Naegleria gruberi strain NEG-M]